MTHRWTPSDLESYLDESLPADEIARLEKALRDDAGLLEQLATVCSQRDAGVHSLSAIWRRHRLSCPTREQLGGHLLGTLPEALDRYIAFHLDVVGCRCCQASLGDLTKQHAEPAEAVQLRRRKYFQSSAGYLQQSRS